MAREPGGEKMTNNKNANYRVWQLAILLIATASLYQFVWLYEVTRYLRDSRKEHLNPLHWIAAPLLGPFFAVPASFLARRLKAWQIEEDREIGYLSEPAFIVMMVLVAFLPLMLVYVTQEVLLPMAVLTVLLLCLPYLALQGQLNCNRGETAAETVPGLRNRALIVLLGAIFSAPLYIYAFTNTWERHGSTLSEVGQVVAVGDTDMQIRIGDDGWTQVSMDRMGADSDLEFNGPDDTTWAVVYVMPNEQVDNVLSFRALTVAEEYGSAECKQMKSLTAEGLNVVGTVECTGRNMLLGSYIYYSRVLKTGSVVVELLSSTSQANADRFAEIAPRVRSFSEGLEVATE